MPCNALGRRVGMSTVFPHGYMRLRYSVGWIVGLCAALHLNAQTPHPSPATYARYTPAECAQLVTRAERQAWRAIRPDTVYHPPTGDRWLNGTIDEARACVPQFDVATTAPTQLVGLGTAYLIAGDDAHASAAFDRLRAAHAGLGEDVRAWDLYQIVAAYANARVPRVAAAQQVANALDRMGKPAAPERMLAHQTLAEIAYVRDSVPWLDAEIHAALAAARDITGDARREWAWSIAGAYESYADVLGRRGLGPAAVAVIDSATAELGPLRAQLRQDIAGHRFGYTLYGQPAPMLTASYWYTSDTAGSAPTLIPTVARPRHGVVSLLLFVSANCGDRCFSGYAVARRLRARFDSSHVDITLVTRTEGWHHNHLIATPADEAAQIRTYFRDTVQLPFPIGIWRTDFGHKADGSLIVKSAPNDRAFAETLAPPLYGVIVDRTGVVRSILIVNPFSEERIRHLITELQ